MRRGNNGRITALLAFLVFIAAIIGVSVRARASDNVISVSNHMAGFDMALLWDYIDAAEETIAEDCKETAEEITSLGNFEVTGYCSCSICCGKETDDPAYGITVTGTEAESGRTAAVDPDVIPLGSRILIDGHEYIAEDTGSLVTGNRIDIYFDSHGEAAEWGLQTKEVWICG